MTSAKVMDAAPPLKAAALSDRTNVGLVLAFGPFFLEILFLEEKALSIPCTARKRHRGAAIRHFALPRDTARSAIRSTESPGAGAGPAHVEPAVAAVPEGSSPPIRRTIRRFAAPICLPRAPAGQWPPGRSGRHGPGRRRAGRFDQLRKERNRSCRSEGPKGRNRRELCSSGLNDPARPTGDRAVPTHSGSRPGRPSALRIRSREFFVSSALRNSPKPSKLCVDHPPAPHSGAAGRRPSSPCARAGRRSQAAAPRSHSQVPLCPKSVFTSRT